MDNSDRIEPIDTNAVLWSASQADRAGRPLLLILHGFGSHEGDLFSFAPYLPLQPAIASLRAPLIAGGGWSWFPIDQSDQLNTEALNAASLGVLQWLDAMPEQPTSIGLLGFSQGGAMALQLMRHAPDRFAFAVQLSGFVAPGERPGDARLAERRPPIFWGRGTLDDVIPAQAIDHTQDWLPAHSTLTERVYEDVPHSVSQEELRDLVAFLREQYASETR
jgi:phospholipase/carboxylesterase